MASLFMPALSFYLLTLRSEQILTQDDLGPFRY